MKQEIKNIKIKDLYLWTENPRDPIDITMTNEEVIDRIIKDDDNKWNIQKLVQKMGEYYDYSELPIVVKKNGKYIVYDGNRRIVLLKLLQNDDKYSKYVGQLFRELEPELLRKQVVLPCNVCDEETAILSVERKHIDNGSWGDLEKDYFLLNFKNKKKTIFIAINEQTGIVENNKILNKRFVKEEVLNEKNLKDIGIEFRNGKLYSRYSNNQIIEILKSIQKALEEKAISTRNNRGKLKSIIIKNKDIRDILNNPKNKETQEIAIDNELSKTFVSIKKTSATRKKDFLFGRMLSLRMGPVNDLYLAIDKIYKHDKDDEQILLVVGMSMRLILDVAARLYYKENNEIAEAEVQNPYKNFIKLFQKNCDNTRIISYLSTTTDFLNKDLKFEALLGNYAHGNTDIRKQDVLKMSYITADILEYYFSINSNKK